MTWHRSRIVTIAIIAIVAGSIANCGRLVLAVANIPAYFGPFEQHNNFQYGRDARHSLDVYKPSGAAHRPVVIFLHGGTWVEGEKEHYRFVGAALAGTGSLGSPPCSTVDDTRHGNSPQSTRRSREVRLRCER